MLRYNLQLALGPTTVSSVVPVSHTALLHFSPAGRHPRPSPAQPSQLSEELPPTTRCIALRATALPFIIAQLLVPGMLCAG
jgi:hypothetical protein